MDTEKKKGKEDAQRKVGVCRTTETGALHEAFVWDILGSGSGMPWHLGP